MEALRERLAVKPEDLRRRVDPAMLPFRTTAEVAPVHTTIGQPRAAEAIAFALEVGVRGFHLYAAGPPGSRSRSWTSRSTGGGTSTPSRSSACSPRTPPWRSWPRLWTPCKVSARDADLLKQAVNIKCVGGPRRTSTSAHAQLLAQLAEAGSN